MKWVALILAGYMLVVAGTVAETPAGVLAAIIIAVAALALAAVAWHLDTL